MKVEDFAPPVVELGDVKARWRTQEVVQFEIPYQFTSGAPRKSYLCLVRFPGTTAVGLRPLEAWELRTEGKLTPGVQVGDADVTKFTIDLREAESPDREYHVISNTVEGELQPRPAVDSN